MSAKKKTVPHRLMNWWPGCGRPKPKTRSREAGTARMTVQAAPRTADDLKKMIARFSERADALVKAISKRKPKKSRRKGITKRQSMSLLGTDWDCPGIPVKTVASLTHEQADDLIYLEPRDAKTRSALRGRRDRNVRSNWWDFAPTPLVIQIDYPLRSVVGLAITPSTAPSGHVFTSAGHVLWHIACAYEKIYGEAEATEAGQKKYGIWGHSIDDLVFEGLKIDEKGHVLLSIGS